MIREGAAWHQPKDHRSGTEAFSDLQVGRGAERASQEFTRDRSWRIADKVKVIKTPAWVTSGTTAPSSQHSLAQKLPNARESFPWNEAKVRFPTPFLSFALQHEIPNVSSPLRIKEKWKKKNHIFCPAFLPIIQWDIQTQSPDARAEVYWGYPYWSWKGPLVSLWAWKKKSRILS